MGTVACTVPAALAPCSCAGKLDFNAVGEVAGLFLTEAGRPGARLIQAGLSAVRSIDSSAIGAMINGYNATRVTMRLSR